MSCRAGLFISRARIAFACRQVQRVNHNERMRHIVALQASGSAEPLHSPIVKGDQGPQQVGSFAASGIQAGLHEQRANASSARSSRHRQQVQLKAQLAPAGARQKAAGETDDYAIQQRHEVRASSQPLRQPLKFGRYAKCLARNGGQGQSVAGRGSSNRGVH